MEDFKSWEEMSVLEQMAAEYWDMYKDAYGFRPRGIDTASWTEEDFLKEFERLGKMVDQAEILREEAQEKAMHDFELRIQDLMRSGAKDREMAMRWIHEAEGSGGDDEYLCFIVGLPYSYFKQEA